MSGVASTDYSTDAALSNQSQNINPFVTPGIIRATAAAVDKSSGIGSHEIIASSVYSPSTTYARIAVASDKIYGVAAAGTLTDLSLSMSKTYSFGVTDVVAFDSTSHSLGSGVASNFISSTDNVAMIYESTGTPTIDETWFTATLSGSNTLVSTVPHPMVVFNGLLWIGNGSNLVSVTTSGVVVPTALVLETTDVIQALHIDPVTGYMMVSATRFSQNHSTSSYIYIFDAFSTLPRRIIPVIDDKITGFHSVNGTVFVGCANRLAVWNGNGITYLRTLKNASASTNADLLYKHHFASYGNILFYVDGATLMAYGEPVGLQRKGFFPICQNPADTSHLAAITLLSTGVIGFGWITSSTPKWYAVDITSASAATSGARTSGIIYFNNVFTPRPIFIRRLRTITSGVTTTAGLGGVTIYNQEQTARTPAVSTFIVASGTKYMFDFEFSEYKVQALQPKITIDTQGFGIARVFIYYDVAE